MFKEKVKNKKNKKKLCPNKKILKDKIQNKN